MRAVEGSYSYKDDRVRYSTPESPTERVEKGYGWLAKRHRLQDGRWCEEVLRGSQVIERSYYSRSFSPLYDSDLESNR